MENQTNDLNLVEAIKFLTEERDDKLYLVTDRIHLHCGTEEQLIMQLKEAIAVNNRLKVLKDGLAMLQETLEYKKIKQLNNK
jgi:hypothetical protein